MNSRVYPYIVFCRTKWCDSKLHRGLRTCAILVPLVTIVLLNDSCSKKATDAISPAPPIILHTYPESGGMLAGSLAGPIQIEFFGTMNPSSLNAGTFWIDGKPGTVSYTKPFAFFTPTTPFDHNASYTAHVAASVTNQDGVELGTVYSWTFTTRDWMIMPVVVRADTAATEETRAQAVVACSDGRYAITGWRGPFSVRSFYLAKVDSNGVPVWETTIPAGGYGDATSLVETMDHGFAIAGQGGDLGSVGTLIKTDASGNVQWQKSLPATFVAGVALATDGNLVTWGESITKYEASTGNQLWSTATSGIVRGVCAGPAGSILYTTNIAGDFEPATSMCGGQIDAAGNDTWFREYYHGVYDPYYGAASITPTSDGNYVILGWRGRIGSVEDAMAIKITTTGDTLWTFFEDFNSSSIDGPFASGCQFRAGVIGFSPRSSFGQSPGPLVYIENQTDQTIYRTSDWSDPLSSQYFWVYGGVPRGTDELIAVGEMTPVSSNPINRPPRVLFLRLKYM
jgi:Bacterial Ig-like domain